MVNEKNVKYFMAFFKEDEYITQVKGKFGEWFSGLEIRTNKRKWPYIGGSKGK